MVAHWPPNSLKEERTICDNVHGSITLFDPLQEILDTREFQRLRELRQLGAVHYVYPTAVHTRFAHSLGVYWIAYRIVSNLIRTDPTLGITGEDHLCVCLAALLHDIGHGPFSHMFDGELQRATAGTSPKLSHEQISLLLVDRLFSQPQIRKATGKYLGDGSQLERNILFIKELIKSVKFNEAGEWIARGRGIEKSFLYDVVSNDNDGIDVDKMDYLCRDSVNTGVAIAFSTNSIERLIANCRVLNDPSKGFRRICYATKVADTVLQIGQARQQLHELLYQHKTVRAIEMMIVRSFVLASNHLKFLGDDGKSYSLSEVRQDMGAYIRTTDCILTQIGNSIGSELEEARLLVEDIERRRIPMRLDEEQYAPDKANDLLTINTGGDGDETPAKMVEKEIRRRMQQVLPEAIEFEKNVLLLTRDLNRGLGRTDPMEKVLLYDSKSRLETLKPRNVHPDWLRLKSPTDAAIWALVLYASRELSKEERELVRQSFDQVVRDVGLRTDGTKRLRTPTP